MKFSTSLISAAAVLTQGCQADYYNNDQYYYDDGAQDYLGQYGVNVPRAVDYAEPKKADDHGIKRCPITGKILSNLNGYDEDEEAEEAEPA